MSEDRQQLPEFDGRSGGRSRRSVSMQVADILRHRILTGEVPSGEALVHEDLAAQLSVSTMPVREALLRLSHEGFVFAHQNRSFRVAETSRADIDDVYWICSVVASELASRACARRGPDLARLIDSLNQQWIGLDKGETREFERINHEIHRAINLSADSPKLSFILRLVTRFIPEQFYTLLPSWRTMAFEGHEALASSFRAGSPERAAAAMARHVQDASEVLASYFSERGYWAPASEAVAFGRSDI
jgi:DNA-binding GntR family transcriptional regulator